MGEITKEKIDRINELYRKSQTDAGLTPEEFSEREELKKEYLDAVRANLRSQLDNIDIKEADGSIKNLGEEHKKREQEG